MKNKILAILLCLSTLSFANDYLEDYNITWDSQSKNCFESMPLGGGDIGLNVWVENNELLFYIGQSGTFDENNQMLKQGRVRMSFSPNPFEGATNFKQELLLEEGGIKITAENSTNVIEIQMWVDVFNPVVHIKTKSRKAIEVKAQYETWRTEDLVVPQGMRHASFSLTGYPGEVVTYRDSIAFRDGAVRWFHRNREDKLLYDMMVDQQGLNGVKDQIPNTQIGRTFGGVLLGEGMLPAGHSKGKYISTDYTSWNLKSVLPQKDNHLKVVLTTGQYDDFGAWESDLEKNIEAASVSRKKTLAWWKAYWERSYIQINNERVASDSSWQVGRNYQLFRYMLGCNAYGDYPSKFNGSLFTVDPVFTRKQYDWTPDFRCWGGGSFTAQNQRLVYWPMLKSGDFDMMPSQFSFYQRALSAAEARTKVYWGHEGACFTEQLENFGLPFAGGWGFETGGRERLSETEFGVQTNRYVCHHYDNQLEFSLMILDYYAFSGNDISKYLPFIKSSIKFFDEHYKNREQQRSGKSYDENGNLVFFPSTAAEMYKIAKNPADVIAALMTVTTRMQELPTNYVSASEKAYYKSLFSHLPAIPMDLKEGHKVIKPAESWEYVANQEIPELYPVFPYGIYGIHQPDLDVAINTWTYGESHLKKKFKVCWSQVGIFAARLGLVEEASHEVQVKLADAQNRFPAFWGPGPDWIPDVDHGGAGMINLQEMLMQTHSDAIYILPTWPKDWDVNFKLYAPKNTIVEVEYVDGKIKKLKVTPKERRADVVID